MTYPTIKPHKHAEVLRAIADGKRYQYKAGDRWNEAWDTNPISQPSWEWRIKPDPKPDYVLCGQVSIQIDKGKYGRSWEVWANLIIDGETEKPKHVELIK